MTMKRRIMRNFRIAELSAVDRPSQAPARAVLMKRHGRGDDDDKERKMQIEEPISFRTFEDACAHLHKIHGGGRADALSAAARRYPQLLEKFQREGDARVEKAAAAAKRKTPEAVEVWNTIVDGVADRDKVARHVAMERARKAHPAEFAAYQAA